jgi:hypothetical protein
MPLVLSHGDLLVFAVRSESHIFWKREDFTAVPGSYLTMSIVINFFFTKLFCAGSYSSV